MHVSLQSQFFLIFFKRSVECFNVKFYILCETELNIGSHNLKRKASYPGSSIFTHIGAQSGNAWNRKCSAAVSDYDRVRNIPFHRGRQLDPLFIILFSRYFFPRASIYTSASARKCISSAAVSRLHALSRQVQRARDAAVTLFVSTRTSMPPDKGINRITSTGERISASEMECARVHGYRDIKYAVARKSILSFICHFLSRIR